MKVCKGANLTISVTTVSIHLATIAGLGDTEPIFKAVSEMAISSGLISSPVEPQST